MDTSQGYMIGGPGCTTFPGNMSRKQERPIDFGSTDTETSANGDQILTDGWAGSKQLEKLGNIFGTFFFNFIIKISGYFWDFVNHCTVG